MIRSILVSSFFIGLVTVAQNINKMSKTQDPLFFLNSLLDVTQTKNIREAATVINKLTIRQSNECFFTHYPYFPSYWMRIGTRNLKCV